MVVVYTRAMNVQFEEDTSVVSRPRPEKASFLTRMILGLKLAKDEKGAQQVMLMISLAALGLAGLLVANLVFGFL